MPEDAQPKLPVGYYLDNFQAVLQDVAARYGDLLHPEERARLDAFQQLPEGAQRLYVRMLTREGPWFRPEKLDYPDIPDGPGALAALLEHGFCLGPDQAGPEALVSLLRKEELAAWLRTFSVPFARGLPRAALAQALLDGVEGSRLQAALGASLHPTAPAGLDWVRLLFFLFFGQGDQDLTAFILADLGRVRYEAYAIDPGNRLFATRQDVDFLLTLHTLREAFEADPAAALAPTTALLLHMEPHPGVRQQRRFHRLLNAVGREWERRGDPAAALACYALSERTPARERTVRLLTASQRLPEAAALAETMATRPLDVAEARFAGQCLRRLARQVPEAALWAAGHPQPAPVPERRLALPRHPSGSVEQAALEAARAEGWEGFFTENTLWNALFGLAFWEQLFAPVPGAFQHRLQNAPADLASPLFHERRAPALEARLRELAEPGALLRELTRTAQVKQGLANAFVNWRALDPAHLAAALEQVPASVTLGVLRVMIPNPTAFRSGFPDLFLYRPGAVLLWEVKGPGDALRPEQEWWLHHFNGSGLGAQVAWVKYLA
jgi:hypothetical protein